MLLEGATQRGDVIEHLHEVMQYLRIIYDVVKVDKEIPAQVLLSKPAILHDARGRIFPFHLEFIDSADVSIPIQVQNAIHVAVLTLALQAFIAVLKVRFKDIGLRKIEEGQFVLEDRLRKHGISLTNSWTTVVRPGQHINMSMVFRRQEMVRAICPGCGEKNEESEVDEVIW